MPGAVSIRLVQTHEEYAACEQISRRIWGAADRNVVPRELLLTVQLNGGQVQGAFLPDGRLAGFVFGFLGMRESRLRLCSHQLGVDAAFRGQGIGLALKMAQREEALRRGLELITWTFDPLEARNGYINLHRLRTVACRYDRDHYGVMDDALNRGLPTDRFEVEWWIRTPFSPHRNPEGAAILLSAGPEGEPRPADVQLSSVRSLLVEVPRDFQEVKRRSPELAQRWRLATRAALEAALAAGFCGTDFTRDGRYLLVR